MVIFDHVTNAKVELLRSRQVISQVVPKIMNREHWFVLLSLNISLLFLLFSLRDGHLLVNAITGFIATCSYFLFFILYELDGDKYLEKQLAYKDVQQVFKMIGKPKYYPEFGFKSGLIQEPKESYRLGIYKNYPTSLEKEIRLIEKK